MRLYSRFYSVLLLVFLASCNTAAPAATPTLRVPIVPTRGVPPTDVVIAGNETQIAALATASAIGNIPGVTIPAIDTPNIGITPDLGTTPITNLGAPTNTSEAQPATNTVEPATATGTATETITASPTPTETETVIPTVEELPTVTPTDTPTETATATPTPTTAVSSTPGVLHYGETVQGEISNEIPELNYTFEGTAGNIVTISMTTTSGDLDTYIVLQGVNGEKLTENDDIARGEGNTNSQIASYVLPSDGTYTIVATRYQRSAGASSGGFELTLETGVPDNSTVVTIDESVEGTIDEGQPSVSYRFDGQENQVISIAVSGFGDLNPQVILLAPDGHEYARNDDEDRRETDALIDGIRLPESGSYTIIVTRYQQQFGFSEGDFELEVTEAEPADSPSTVLSRPIEYDATEEGSVGDNLPYYQIFTFAGRAGDVVTIQMGNASDDLDPLLVLTDAQGHEIMRNDDDMARNNTTNAALREVILPTDGFYTIITSRYEEADGTTSGDFELELSLEQSADESDVRAVYGVLDTRLSGAARPDNNFYNTPFYAVGDDLNDSNREIEVQAVLTFQLPTDITVESAVIDLSLCREIGEGFRGLGDLAIYADPYDALETAGGEPSSDAELLDGTDECTAIDITDAVVGAYDDGQQILQIRLAFEDGVDRNDEPDYVWFDPRLTIFVAN